MPATVAPSPSTFAGETVGVRIAGEAGQIPGVAEALLSSLQSAFPAAQFSTSDPGQRVRLELGVLSYGSVISGSRWVGHTVIDAFLADRRNGETRRLVSTIRGRAERTNIWGRGSDAEAARSAFQDAATTLVDMLRIAASGEPGASWLVIDSLEYAPYLATTGTAEITGQAFLTTRGGEVRLGAGRTVTLDPATSFARRWLETAGTDATNFGYLPPDDLFRAARRTTVADAEGRFRFSGVPAGTYILRAPVTWEIPSGNIYSSALVTEGGVVSSVVEVRSGQRQEVILSQIGGAAF